MSDILARLRMALAGRYGIERELGRGGMGTVYLAEDLKHHRPVALKVLLPELAATLGAERFLREIQVAAQLAHPHIVPLYDSGEADGCLFYVMPYAAGETLKDRLNREKQLAVGDAVEIARQVAGALAYAHTYGVVHRDVKPGNILLHAGQAMVADFGIARAVLEAGGDALTQTGLVVGTPEYMSPEQASGEGRLDARSDVYSLGCVLYEMLAGEPPFTGPSVQAIIARKLSDNVPELRLVRETVPAVIENAIRKALAKIPADRFADAQRFSDALVIPSLSPTLRVTRATAASPHALRRLVPFIVLGALAAVGGAGLWEWLRSDLPTEGIATRFSVVPPTGVQFVPEKATPTLALSPAGTQLVYLGSDATGERLYVRTMDRLEANPVVGTENAFMPFFSPDGKWLGFASGGELKKVALAGGPPVTIAKTPRPRGASWSANGDIVFAPMTRGGLLRVSASGGEPRVVTKTERPEESHRWVEVLPGDKAVVFTVWTSGPEDARIAVAPLETGIVKVLLLGIHAWYAPTGHLVFARADGTLHAAPFDLRRLEVTGPSVPIVAGVVVKLTGAADFALSASGAVAYLAAPPVKFTLVVIDPQGSQKILAEGPSLRAPRFSPDGQRVAVGVQQSFKAADIWLCELGRGPLSRLTLEGGSDPIWTRDGKRVTFTSDRAGVGNLRWTPSDFSGSHGQLLTGEQSQTAGSWSGDGRFLVFTQTDPVTRRDIWVLEMNPERTHRPFLRTPFSEGAPALSPDDRWLAYESNESGSYEVYVRPFPEPGRRWQVSSGGGSGPRWGMKGRKLFYWQGDNLFAATVSTEPVFAVENRSVVSDLRNWLASSNDYDVEPDGERLVLARVGIGQEPVRLISVQHWLGELRHYFER